MKDPVAAQQAMSMLSENVVYLMGLSFLLGSLFTIFILIFLDFLRRNNNQKR